MRGQILDLRVWGTARAQSEIRRQRFRQLSGDEPDLALWWQFDRASDGLAPDRSPHGRVGQIIAPAQIAPIGAPAPYALPVVPLDEATLGGLADVKRFKERYSQPLDRLAALWNELPHSGKADGRTLFDDTFNPKGSAFTPWAFHLDTPIRWDRSGASDQQASRQIRSRLMGALRLSHEQLDGLVSALSGQDEGTITLDGPYLANLYRLARQPSLLRLSVEEFLRLLRLLGLQAVNSLESFRQVGERADWMRETGIDVYELDFLANDQESARARFPYSDATIRDSADGLRRQATEFLASPAAFVTREVSRLQSAGLFSLLRELGILDALGAVDPGYAPPTHFEQLFFIAAAGAAPDIAERRIDMRATAFAALSDAQLADLQTQRLISDLGLAIDQDGRVITDLGQANLGEQRLKALFPSADAAGRAALAEALARGLKIQTDLAEALARMRDDLNRATLSTLAALVGSDPERTQAVAGHLAPQLTLKQLFVMLVGLGSGPAKGGAIPAELVGIPGGFLYRMSKILYLAAQFGLTVDEVNALVGRPAQFGVANILHPALDDLSNLHRFRSLKLAFADTEGRLLALLEAAEPDRQARVAALTGWEPRQIAAAAALDKSLAINQPDGLDRVRQLFLIAQTLGVDVGFVLQLADTSDLSYAFYARQSAALLEVLRARYNDEQWPQVERPIHDRLATQRRDALLARAMLVIPPEFAGRRSPDVLSEYLLLDLQTGPEVDTSRLVQAIASVQLYVQRCLMNLERGIDPASIPPEQWAWMKNYRVWEANRKVFLYPENYIQPELRDSKTPLFKELEQDLMQGEITQELVEKAYTKYLQKFAELANLQIVGSYRHIEQPGAQAGTPDEVLYLVGATRSEPSTSYVRMKIGDRTWTPWEATGLNITANTITPVYAFKRLFLFWVELLKVTEARPVPLKPGEPGYPGNKLKIDAGNTKIEDQENIDVYKATIKFSYRTLSGDWSTPQTYMELGRNLEKYEAIRPEWQRVYLQRFLSFSVDGTVSVTVENLQDLSAATIRSLRTALAAKSVLLSQNLQIATLDAGQRWRIEDLDNQTNTIVTRAGNTFTVVPVLARTDLQPLVLEVTNETRLHVTPPRSVGNALTWELWAFFARADASPDLTQEQQIDSQSVTLIAHTSPLFGIGDRGLVITATSNVTRDPNAPDMRRLRADLDAAIKTRDSRDKADHAAQEALDQANGDLKQLRARVDPKPTDAELNAAQDNVDQKSKERAAAAAELTKANAAVSDAQQRIDSERKKNQWQSVDLTVRVTLNGVNLAETTAPYGRWQHLALALTFANNSCTFELRRAESATDTGAAQVAGSVSVDGTLPTGRDVVIGAQSVDSSATWFTAQLSEARLWDHARDGGTTLAELGERRDIDQGQPDPTVLVAPLNRAEPGATMRLTSATGNLSFRTFIEPPEQRERILLLWGDEVQRSIRNTLQNDEEFTISLRADQQIPESYSVDMVLSKLFVVKESRLSLNDYAIGQQTTISRYPPDVRLIITTAVNNNYVLSDSEIAQIRPLLGSLSAFGKVSGVDLGDPDSVKQFLEQTLHVKKSDVRVMADVQAENRLLDKVSSYEATFADVGNQPGWYIVDTSDEQFLVRIINPSKPLRSAADRLKFYYSDEGWRGEYFNGTDLQGAPVLVRTDPAVNFTWAGGSPGAGVATDLFSARWTRLAFFDLGEYSFKLVADDGVRLYIDGELLIDEWKNTPATTYIAHKTMAPGWHELKIEYYEQTGDATIQFGYDRSADPKIRQIAGPQESATRSLSMFFAGDKALDTSKLPAEKLRISFERLSTFAVHELSERLFAQGIDGLISLDSQSQAEIDFVQKYQPGAMVVPPGFSPATGTVEGRIDFDGAHGLYYREIFFHLPFFIANQLNASQRFEEAQRWYHYIFNPTVAAPKALDPGVNPNDRYWQFRPFRNISLETLREMLTNHAALDAYHKDPFDPHAIAALRVNAYQKAIVMKYIDNLLDWGDSLFMQDSRESISESIQLYFLAYNILGSRPKSKPVKEISPVGSLDDVLTAQQGQRSLPDFVVELERRLPAVSDGTVALTPNNVVLTSFGVVENDLFLGYWDRVEDRLYKIRHSLNFEGTFRQLALFQPPINPMDLVNAVAGGRDLGSVLGDLNVPAPHYRFSIVLERAKGIAELVKDLGEALLGALESKDEGDLAALEHTHEGQILALTTTIKEQEVSAADAEIEALTKSRESIQTKYDYYDKLINDGLIGREIAGAVFRGLQAGLKAVEGIAKTGKAIVGATPKFTAGVAGFGGTPLVTTEVGGDELDTPLEAIGEASSAASEIFGYFAEAAEKGAEYERRAEEWKHERTIAGHELIENEKQLLIAGLQLDNARRELAIHQRTIAQHEEIADFNRNKFTSTQLYSWMAGRISGLYFQAYKLAYAYAKSAEKAMQFEMLSEQSFISFGHWDSLKKGLLAGESLLLELSRMEKWQLDQDSRYQDMEKVISMQKSMPDALASLKQNGSADFQLTEAMFNRDFPGHYGRMLKMIYISIKTSSEIDPYDSVHATLYQLGNKVLLEPSIDAARYLMGVDGATQPDTSVLRVNWRANQQITISKVEEDNGVFAIDFFFDNRYFPFEGTGAVSAWRLEMLPDANRFDRSTITDVVIKIGYSAKYDNGAFRQAVINEVRNLAG